MRVTLGVHAVLDGSCQRKGLKRGAHGSLCRSVVHVILVGVVVVAAHHALDVAGLRGQRRPCPCPGRSSESVSSCARARPPRPPAAWWGSMVVLTVRPPLKEHVGGELLLQQLLDVGDKVGLRVHIDATARNLGHVKGDGLSLCGIVLSSCVMWPRRSMLSRTLLRAGQCQVGIDRGSYCEGRVGKADEQRGLAQGEVGGALGQIGFGWRLDAVGAVTVVDGVEVHHEDLVFGVHVLHLDGDVGLAHRSRSMVESNCSLLQDGVAHQLLGDSRGAFVPAAEGLPPQHARYPTGRHRRARRSARPRRQRCPAARRGRPRPW